jgi:hypothetical protein
MRSDFDYHGTRKNLARLLLRNAEAHEAGSWNYLDRDYEEIERAVPREGYPEIETLLIALDFWKAWIESILHGRPIRAEIRQEDWPLLARRIVDALESDRGIDDPTILTRFGLRRPVD